MLDYLLDELGLLDSESSWRYICCLWELGIVGNKSKRCRLVDFVKLEVFLLIRRTLASDYPGITWRCNSISRFLMRIDNG